MFVEIGERLKNSVKTAITFGIGFVLGNVLSSFLFDSVNLYDFSSIEGDASKFLYGIILMLLFIFLGGAVAGFIGGWVLPTVNISRTRWGYSWKGAISIGIPYTVVLTLFMLIVYLLAVGDTGRIELGNYVAAFGILGCVFGLISGILLGLWTVGRRFWVVSLASMIGFGIGGLGLGYAFAKFMESIPPGALLSAGNGSFFLVGLFVFGLVGGFFLSYIYDYLNYSTHKEYKAFSRKVKIIVGVIGLIVFFYLGSSLWTFWNDLTNILTPRSANHASTLNSDAEGVHWSFEDIYESESISEVATADLKNERTAVAWIEGEGPESNLKMRYGIQDQGLIKWMPQLDINVAGVLPKSLNVIMDDEGVVHIYYIGQVDELNERIDYVRCTSSGCDRPIIVAVSGSICPGVNSKESTVGSSLDVVQGSEEFTLVWSTLSGEIESVSWNTFEGPDQVIGTCIRSILGERYVEPQISSGPSEAIVLSYGAQKGDDNKIYYIIQQNSLWNNEPELVGNGLFSDVLVDHDGEISFVWCDKTTGVYYKKGSTSMNVSRNSCSGMISMEENSHGEVHVVFKSDEIEKSTGNISEGYFLFESIRSQDKWIEPMLVVSSTSDIFDFSLKHFGSSELALAHTEVEENTSKIFYGTQAVYDCSGFELNSIEENVLRATYNEKYRSDDDVVAYCGNKYERLIYTPNPSPEFSDYPPTHNGAFDQIAGLVTSARYEVLFATMTYTKSVHNSGPGTVLGKAIVELYEDLRNNPEKYPRGMTVRVLLGNTPPVATMELNSQLWDIVDDFRDAGVETMYDEDLGWKLEVANYEGTLPHSHSKFLVIDGKRVMVNGFNFQFSPLPADHDSGEGLGEVDLGIQVLGPVAQDSRRVYDELWDGAVQRYCSDLNPPYKLWQVTCRDRAAQVSHVPEVMRYYPTDENDFALSMFRDKEYDQADQQVYAALSSAQKSIDIMHTSFTWPLLCNLNHFFNLCNYDQAPDYVQSTFQNFEKEDISVRILLRSLPPQGIENSVGIDIMRKEIEKEVDGSSIEVRYYPSLFHPKTILIDNSYLIVGSQNLHYSAFGRGGGLTEYSIAVSDPEAIDDFKRMFEFYWEQSK